jgi:hypothetical protein
MRYDIGADSLRFYADPSEKSATIRAQHLAYARFETTISHRVEGMMDLVFDGPDGIAIVPWITLDGVMLLEPEVSALVWPSWMRWLDPDECDAIEARVEPWLRSHIVARFENGFGERFFSGDEEFRELMLYAKDHGWLGAALSSDVLTSIAPHRYAWRFAAGSNALVCGPGAANGGALLARRTKAAAVVLGDAPEAEKACRWFGLECFLGTEPEPRRWDLYIGPRDGKVDAASKVVLDGEARDGELRVPVARPLPLGIMVSFDLDDAPEVGAMAVTSPPRPSRTSALNEAASIGGSSGRVALVVREDIVRAADADTDAVDSLARRLRAEGFNPEIVTPSHFDGRVYDLIHVFGFRYASAVLEQLEICAQREIPIAVTPYADDAADEHRLQAHNVMSAVSSSFDEGLREEYFTALSRRRLRADAAAPEGDPGASRLFQLARVAFVTSPREEQRLRTEFGYTGVAARVPAYAERLTDLADVAALTGGDDYILVRGPVDWRSNQYMIARAAARAGLPLVVTGAVADALAYLKVKEALGDLGIWLPASTLTPAQERGLVCCARVVADVSWSGMGLHRLATAAAVRCSLVASSNGYARDLWGDLVPLADPASVDSIATALQVAWQQAGERGGALAAVTAAQCDPFAALVATVAGYQAAAASPVRS